MGRNDWDFFESNNPTPTRWGKAHHKDDGGDNYNHDVGSTHIYDGSGNHNYAAAVIIIMTAVVIITVTMAAVI